MNRYLNCCVNMCVVQVSELMEYYDNGGTTLLHLNIREVKAVLHLRYVVQLLGVYLKHVFFFNRKDFNDDEIDNFKV